MQPQTQPQTSAQNSSVPTVAGIPQYHNMYQYTPAMYYPYMNYAMPMYNGYQQPIGVPGQQSVEFPTSNFKTDDQQGKANDDFINHEPNAEAVENANGDAQNDAVKETVCTNCRCQNCVARRDGYAQIESVKTTLDAILRNQEGIQARLSAIEKRLELDEAHSAETDGEAKKTKKSVEIIGNALSDIAEVISLAGFGRSAAVEAPLVAAVATAEAVVEDTAMEVVSMEQSAPETTVAAGELEQQGCCNTCDKEGSVSMEATDSLATVTITTSVVEDAKDFSDDDEKPEAAEKDSGLVKCSKCNEYFDCKNGRYKMCTECYRQLTRPKGGYQKKRLAPPKAAQSAKPVEVATQQLVPEQTEN